MIALNTLGLIGVWILAVISVAGFLIAPRSTLAHVGAISALAFAVQLFRWRHALWLATGFSVALLAGCFVAADSLNPSTVLRQFVVPLMTVIAFWAVASFGALNVTGQRLSGEETTRVDAAADLQAAIHSRGKASHFDFDSEYRSLMPLLAERLSPASVLQSAVHCGLITQEQAQEERFAAPNANLMCEHLMHKGLLTRYQASCICGSMAEMLVIGDYVVLDRIGRGGMAVVLHVRHRHTGHDYAMKLFEQMSDSKADLKHRFLREMEAVKELAHPNIAIAKDAGQSSDRLYIVMEYVEGRNLAHVVRDRGPLPLETALDYLQQAASALRHAHSRGLVHRDIKPGNLICTEGNRIKLVDLGLARFVDELERQNSRADTSVYTQFGQLMGTIDYMAPEQAKDMATADERSDIYSLGCTFFFMLTGESHLQGRSEKRRARALVNSTGFRDLKDAQPHLPGPAYQIFRRMTARNPRDRYPSVDALITDLHRLSSQLGVSTQDDVPPVHVLVVEDSRTDSLYTLMHLEQAGRGFQATVANRLSAAFRKLDSEHFELVLLDLNLPDSEGVETVERIRERDPDIGIIVLTGGYDTELVISCIAAGADDFLPKSAVDVQTLERHILLTLSRREALSRGRGRWPPPGLC